MQIKVSSFSFKILFAGVLPRFRKKISVFRKRTWSPYRSLTIVEVYRSHFAEFMNFCSFCQKKKRVLAANKMVRQRYNAYFVILLRQLNEALEKCNFVRSMDKIWGIPPHEELNEEDRSAREISY